MSEQPEALRLAHWLERDGANCQAHIDAAAELRRLHAVNQELLGAYTKMRASAAGYSNFCDADNANTTRSERNYVEAEALYRAAITKAEGRT
jgi:hypothetical protein